MFQQLFETLGHLPVAGIAADVVASVANGTVTVVASATGSGKTLLLPPAWAEVTNEPVVVLVPRRFLAVNAAETVAELAELKLGEEVGYAVGGRGGDDSVWAYDTKVLYCTYGYAIASDLILKGKKFAFDEVHEASLDMSICRAILYRRLAAGENVQLLEMSATINAQRQAAYWQQVAQATVMEIDGKTFPCERRHRPAQPPHEAAVELILQGCTGILVFRPGRGEVEETAQAIRAMVGEDVEVAEIYGELDYAGRKAAVAAPKGKAKVLVGTNVVESGANIPWLDAGVSCGTAKEPSVRPETGATYLGLINLPRWRLQQQEGRIKRFRAGTFVLCAPLSYEDRDAETTPEIKRLPLTELVLHCANYGIRAEELVFDYAPEQERIVEAEVKLQRLGLLDADCRLTQAGKWVSNMPVGPETGAMLWHAKQIGVLGAALPLAAVIEVDGVRKDFREPHGLDSTSDWLDAYKAFGAVYGEAEFNKRKQLMERYNVSYKRYEAAKEMLHDLRRRFNGQASSTMQATDDQLRLCLVSGFVTNLLLGGQELKPAISDSWTCYNLGNSSAVLYCNGYALGQLRTIQPRDRTKQAFTVVEKITVVSLDDILAVAKARPEILVTEKHRMQVGYFNFHQLTVTKLFGVYEVHRTFCDSPLTIEEQNEKDASENANRAARRMAKANRRDAGKKRIENLNRRREALGWQTLDDCGVDFYFGGRYVAYTDEEGIQQAERQVTAEERRIDDAAAQQTKAETFGETLTRLGERFTLRR